MDQAVLAAMNTFLVLLAVASVGCDYLQQEFQDAPKKPDAGIIPDPAVARQVAQTDKLNADIDLEIAQWDTKQIEDAKYNLASYRRGQDKASEEKNYKAVATFFPLLTAAEEGPSVRNDTSLRPRVPRRGGCGCICIAPSVLRFLGSFRRF
jgi:hypothetical protein